MVRTEASANVILLSVPGQIDDSRDFMGAPLVGATCSFVCLNKKNKSENKLAVPAFCLFFTNVISKNEDLTRREPWGKISFRVFYAHPKQKRKQLKKEKKTGIRIKKEKESS